MRRWLILAGSVLCLGTGAAAIAEAPSAVPPILIRGPSASPEEQLLSAAMQGQARRVAELLAEGVSPDARVQAGGWTPLMMAAPGDFQAVVKILLDAGAHPNLARWDGETALMIAALTGAEHVAALLAPRSELESRDLAGNTALTYAALNGRTEIIDILLHAGARADAVDHDGRTALHHAALEGQAAAAQRLIAAKAALDRRDNWGQTPLFVAAAQGYGDVVRVLLAAGASPDVADETGRAPLHWAVLWNDNEAVGALLDRGAAVDRRAGAFDSGVTALILAAWTGKNRLVDELLRRGADPNVVDDNGETALHWAAATDQAAALRLLLAGGADAARRNHAGQTAYDIAVYEGRHEAMDVLAAARGRGRN